MANPRNKKKKPKGSPPEAQATPDSGEAQRSTCQDWEWWHAEPGGRKKPYEDYLNARRVPPAVRSAFDKLRKGHLDGTLRQGKDVKFLHDGIFELRLTDIGNTPYRLLFMHWSKYAITLDVFKKTTDKTPTERAAKRRAEWLKMFGPGT